ncbi:prepilin-type N-terminal cleavage/methylation domain-containing protein, partial [bacterium]|nr:prepilin-type N-terminal cleavage/methylation domain-containing protein [bacterium]
MRRNIKKFGFTLAEVLITIGIIGAIAAMTIPTLKDAYEEHMFEAQAKATYNHIMQAVALSKFSGDAYYGNSPAAFYNRYIKENLKITKYCGSIYTTEGKKCWKNNNATSESEQLTIKNLKGEAILRGVNEVTFTTDNNEAILIAQVNIDYRVNLPDKIENAIVIYYDTNGRDNEPNMLGYDTFILVWNGRELVPAGKDATPKVIAENCKLDSTAYIPG